MFLRGIKDVILDVNSQIESYSKDETSSIKKNKEHQEARYKNASNKPAEEKMNCIPSERPKTSVCTIKGIGKALKFENVITDKQKSGEKMTHKFMTVDGIKASKSDIDRQRENCLIRKTSSNRKRKYRPEVIRKNASNKQTTGDPENCIPQEQTKTPANVIKVIGDAPNLENVKTDKQRSENQDPLKLLTLDGIKAVISDIDRQFDDHNKEMIVLKNTSKYFGFLNFT